METDLQTEGTSTGDDEEQRRLMHVDLDMFFAAVELRKNPVLRGEPVIVGNPKARETNKGVVLTCTYEARKFGVKSGMSMFEALQKCPQAIIVPPSRSEYSETSRRVMKYLKSFGVPIRIASIDEAYLDITEITDTWKDAYNLAWKIQEDLFELEKLTCSIGIAPTLKIAKIASDYDKPKGITIVKPEDLPGFFVGLKVSKIPGIGQKTSERLRKRGIEVCDQLINLSLYELQSLFGSMGEHLYRLFRGQTSNRIREREPRKSVSHESTFHGKPGDHDKYYRIFHRLFQRSYETLFREKWKTKTITLKIRFSDFRTITRSKSLPTATNDEDKLRAVALSLLEPHLDNPLGIRLMGVGFSGLEPIDSRQMTLTEFLEPTM